MMTPRQRMLAALRHEPVDRCPTMMFWGHLHAPDGRAIDGDEARERFGVDGRVVRMEPEVAEPSFQTFLQEIPPDVYVGDLEQLRRYCAWNYRPHAARGAEDAPADAESIRFPEFGRDAAHVRAREAIERYHQRDLAVFALPPRLGGIIFEAGWRMRGGFETFLIDLIERKPTVLWLLDRLTDLVEHHAEVLAGCGADVLYLGDDLGDPTHMLIAPDLWRELFKPRLARIIATARKTKPDLLVGYHSDGYIAPILGDLAEIGVSAIEPAQPDCMDVAGVRREYGDRLALIGTVGTAWLLDCGSPAAVAAEVGRRIDALGPTGLVVAPAYDVVPATPWGNVEALFATAMGRGCAAVGGGTRSPSGRG